MVHLKYQEVNCLQYYLYKVDESPVAFSSAIIIDMFISIIPFIISVLKTRKMSRSREIPYPVSLLKIFI